MNGPLLVPLLLIAATAAQLPVDDDAARYCRICRSHTMCRFPYDDPGASCEEVEDGDLADDEIIAILHRHNSLRDVIARGERGRGARVPAVDMMQVVWDEELARIARRWALQCKIHDKDLCRHVRRFRVLQNVNALDLGDVGNRSALERLEFHIRTWYDQLDLQVDWDGEEAALAAPPVSHVGCGRTTYRVYVDEAKDPPRPEPSHVETLVCNYGPAEALAPIGECEARATQYPALCPADAFCPAGCYVCNARCRCVKLQEGFSRRRPQRPEEEEAEAAEYERDAGDEEFPFRMLPGGGGGRSSGAPPRHRCPALGSALLAPVLLEFMPPRARP